MTSKYREDKIKYHPLRISTYIYILIIPIFINPAYGLSDKHSSAYEEKLLSYINQYRVKNGLKPILFDETLNHLAKSHSRYMCDLNDLNHDNFNERFKQCRRLLCVENVGWNYPTPETQFRAWKNSRDHNANLLNKKIKHAGISKVGSYVTFFACN